MSEKLPPGPPGELIELDTGWAAVMRWYVTGGHAARLGPYASTALIVLATYADHTTGYITGLTVDDIAREGGISRDVVIKKALPALRAGGWLDEIPRARNQRAHYRLRYRAGAMTPTGEIVAEADWSHVPHTAGADRVKAKETALGRPAEGINFRVYQNITINQQIAPGGVGIVTLPPPVDGNTLPPVIEQTVVDHDA